MLNNTTITPFRAPLSPVYLSAAFFIPFMVFITWHNQLPFGFVDETYNPMVYAQNIAEGYGIVFSPGGEKVEGFESPLWVFILTIASISQMSMPFIVYWISMFSAIILLVLVLAFYINAFAKHDPPTFWNLYFFPCMVAMITVLDVAFISWSASGLETISYSLILTALCYGCMTQQPPRLICTLLLMFALLRFEGILFLPLIWFRLLFLPSKIKAPMKSLLIIVIIPYILFLLLRYSYFGYWLPNLYYAAIGMNRTELFYNGIDYIAAFIQPRLILLMAILGILLEREICKGKSRWIQFFIVFHILMVACSGGSQSTLHRLMIPILPLLSILTIRGIQRLAYLFIMQRITRSSGIKVLFTQSILSILIMGIAAIHALQLYNSNYQIHSGTYNLVQDHFNHIAKTEENKMFGKWLKDQYPKDTTIAVFNSGSIPFFSRLQCIDILGFNNVHIAHQPAKVRSWKWAPSHKSDADYVLNQKPKIILLFPDWGIQPSPQTEQDLKFNFISPAQLDLYNHHQFKEEYIFSSVQTSIGYFSFYTRK